MWLLVAAKVGKYPPLISWVEAANVVDVPNVNATAIKRKIDNILPFVFMLAPEPRYSLYGIGLT